MLDKLGGVWAPRPSTGPHKLRECLPMIILLRNRLKYALNTKEVKYILMQRLVKVDGKARTDKTYPTGFMGAQQPLSLLCRDAGLQHATNGSLHNLASTRRAVAAARLPRRRARTAPQCRRAHPLPSLCLCVLQTSSRSRRRTSTSACCMTCAAASLSTASAPRRPRCVDAPHPRSTKCCAAQPDAAAQAALGTVWHRVLRAIVARGDAIHASSRRRLTRGMPCALCVRSTSCAASRLSRWGRRRCRTLSPTTAAPSVTPTRQ